MYYVSELTSTIKLNASDLNISLKNGIKNGIIRAYERKIIGDLNSFIISILSILDQTEMTGTINDIDGSMTFNVIYRALVFRPENDSVIDLVVTSCNDVGIWGYPTLVYKNKESYISEMQTSNKIIIECVIPKEMLSQSFKYDTLDNSWNRSEGLKIIKGSEIKVKVINFIIEMNKINMIGNVL